MPDKQQKIRTLSFSGMLLPPFRLVSFVDYFGRMADAGFHHHEGYQTLLIMSGTLAFRHPGGGVLQADAGEVCVIPPGMPHSWAVLSEETCATLNIVYDGLSPDRFGGLARIFPDEPGREWWKVSLPPEDRLSLAERQERIREDCGASGLWVGGTLSGRLLVLLGLIARQRCESALCPLTERTPQPVRLCLDHIEANFREELTLERLASVAGLGISRFSELFRKHTGVSPMKYVNDLRLRKAETLLACSDLNISQIADGVGFRSVHYFSRAFRQHAGKSPRQSRNSMKNGA